ncbi:hypothetical protein PDIDSM_6975 [Penicillium digitatum]|nr:hypothetical protein PDIDSM_6975 [Penicillium digitatum]
MSASLGQTASSVPDASNVRWQFSNSSNNSRTNLTQVKHKSNGDINIQRRARRATRKQSIRKEDLNVEFRYDVFASKAIPSDLPSIESNDTPLFLPFRQSSVHPQGVPLPLDGFVDVHPQSYPSHDLCLDSFSWPSSSAIPYQFMPPPNTITSDAKIGTVNTLSIPADQDEHGIFDSYVYDMPASSYGSFYRSPTAHNGDASAFVSETMKDETQNPLLHVDRAVSMFQEQRAVNPHGISDVAIISCLSAAALEDCDPRPGHKEISRVHMRAAREMIRARGGPAAFTNTRIGMMINWQNYLLPRNETHEPSVFCDYDQPASLSSESLPTLPQSIPNPHSMPSPPYSTASAFSELSPSPKPQTMLPSHSETIPIDEIKFQCEEFFDFLRRCEQLARYKRDNPQSSYLIRHTAVQKTSILYQVLVAPPDARFITVNDRKQMVARLTALMTLNAAMWDYRNTPARAAIFLGTIEKSMVDSEVGMNSSVDAMLQTLLKCSDGTLDRWPSSADSFASTVPVEELPDFSQYFPTAASPSARPWFVGRMLKVTSRLGSLSWYRVNEFLFSCLTLQVQESSTAIWEEELRREILDAPTTCVMRPLDW